MKTRNDILAEYVRSRYPEIEKTFDFAAYSAGVALKEFGRCIKEAFGGRRCLRFRTLRPGSFCTAQTTDTVLLTSNTKMLTYSSIAEAAHDLR